ncbi:MAG: hypothetical protein IH912_12100 [Proteobacteria bacterium]|nr:hypothetical protein [Pseudomonadota bacterium]
MTYRLAVLFGAALFFRCTGAIAQGTDEILDFIDGRYESTADMARTLWEYAEVGYQETKSSALIQAALSADGFAIEAGIDYATLRERDKNGEIERWLEATGGQLEDYAFVPFATRFNVVFLGIRRSDRTLIGLLDVPAPLG